MGSIIDYVNAQLPKQTPRRKKSKPKPSGILFITNRLGNDGVAISTQYQIKVLTEKLGISCFIATGRIDRLWGGNESIYIIEELDIPDTQTKLFLKNELSDENSILEKGKAISGKISEIIDKHRINLLFVQNTNSLIYNLSSAVANLLISLEKNINVISQCYDFFWEHAERNREIFSTLNIFNEKKNLYDFISQWSDKNWVWTFHTHEFRNQYIERSKNNTKTGILTTPVFADNSNIEFRIEIKNSNIINLRSKFSIKYGTTNSKHPGYAVLIPAKISRKKRVFETAEIITTALSKHKNSCHITISLSGAIYDNETEDGLTILENQLLSFLDTARHLVETGAISSFTLNYLNGTKRFDEKEGLLQLMSIHDIICLGSDRETDCLTIYEATLAKKILWLNEWEGSYRNIFIELFGNYKYSTLLDVTLGKMLLPESANLQNSLDRNFNLTATIRSKEVFEKQFQYCLDLLNICHREEITPPNN